MGNIKDLKGNRFGRLLVLEFAGSIKGRAHWKCLCDCGNEVIVNSKYLQRGDVKSCGCIKKETPRNFNDLTGKKFGYLTAIKRVGDYVSPSGKRRVRWLCKCDCGKETLVLAESLVGQNTKSCGCILSSGENKVESLLIENGIPFIKQKTFDDLRTDKNYPLKFDFFVLGGNYLIEYDGEQHFVSRQHGWMTEDVINENKRRDRIKDIYCRTHEIPLIRIPYTHYKNLCIRDLRVETSTFIVK